MSTENQPTVKKIFDSIKLAKGLRKDSELASLLGTTKQNIFNWQKRNSIGDYGLFVDRGFCEYYMRTGRGPMMVSDKIPLLGANVTAGPDIIGGIPLISFVQAGGWAEIVDNLQPGDAEEWIPRISGVGPRSFALRVSGTSMAPDYQPGDIIVVDPDCQHNNGSLVVARLNGDNEATFKRIVIDGGKTFLEPINQRYQPLDITGRDVTICGVVRQMLRNVQ